MRVRFTRPALRDLEKIASFISKDNPQAASNIVTRLTKLGWSLGDNPEEGMKTDEPDTFVLVVPKIHYLIFYSIKSNQIDIAHFRHTSRPRPAGWRRR
jgi:addiction module RelE/StbE family toxin